MVYLDCVQNAAMASVLVIKLLGAKKGAIEAHSPCRGLQTALTTSLYLNVIVRISFAAPQFSVTIVVNIFIDTLIKFF